MTSDPNGWPDPARPGVPLNPEQHGAHRLRHVHGELERDALWSCGGTWLDTDGDFSIPHAAAFYIYLGPCLTPAEVAARCEEAASAASAAWRAAPEGEGVMGAEYIAELAALLVLRDGMDAPAAVDQAIKERNAYGVPQKYVLVAKAEVAAREAAAAEAMREAVRGWIAARRKEMSKRGIVGGHQAMELALLEEVLGEPAPVALDRVREEAWREGMEIAAGIAREISRDEDGFAGKSSDPLSRRWAAYGAGRAEAAIRARMEADQ